MKFTEDTRVKIPTILHLVRLGYQYVSLKDQQWDLDTNLFPDLFKAAISKINPGVADADVDRLLADVRLTLDNDDLGQAFFNKLTDRSGIKLIDFEHFNKNSFHVVTELTYQNGDEEFRPDITLLINGMPLVFIEVKKPNNREGILAERDRINKRFQNPKFKRFVNVTQLMVFSNNMEYDDGDVQPIQGAFYASPSYQQPQFNYFREEEVLNLTALLTPLADETELAVLKDNNLEVIRSNPEFITNKDPNRPTNRICSSLLSRERLAFILRYALTYVHETDGLQKHVMRYPQLFATKAIERKLNEGVKKGIIWHTQGSGKTALAFYNVRFLTDYFQQRQIVPKFYFIVDRIDLLTQAHREFTSRGLMVHTIDSREAFKGTLTWLFIDAATRYYHPDRLLSDQRPRKEKRLAELFLSGIFQGLIEVQELLNLTFGFEEFHQKAPLVAMADLAKEPYKRILRSRSAGSLLSRRDGKKESRILKLMQSADLVKTEVLEGFLKTTRTSRLIGVEPALHKEESRLPYLFPTRPLTALEISELAPECVGLRQADGKICQEKPSVIWAKYTQAIRGVWIKPTLLATLQDGEEEKKRSKPAKYLRIGTEKKRKIVVALTNLKTDDSDWAAMACNKSNLSRVRYRRISDLVNHALRLHPKPDYLLFPELSLPLAWVDRLETTSGIRLGKAGVTDVYPRSSPWSASHASKSRRFSGHLYVIG
ncbi:type I restriction endonuclease [Methylomonas albis]|uniref:type I restriction endonuclease n=1 Tax=Methylomonas albis TaxID=1854563 RepID=UPI001CAA8270|nr:type I restriction endonuclease [Methylomonas albis]